MFYYRQSSETDIREISELAAHIELSTQPLQDTMIQPDLTLYNFVNGITILEIKHNLNKLLHIKEI